MNARGDHLRAVAVWAVLLFGMGIAAQSAPYELTVVNVAPYSVSSYPVTVRLVNLPPEYRARELRVRGPETTP